MGTATAPSNMSPLESLLGFDRGSLLQQAAAAELGIDPLTGLKAQLLKEQITGAQAENAHYNIKFASDLAAQQASTAYTQAQTNITNLRAMIEKAGAPLANALTEAQTKQTNALTSESNTRTQGNKIENAQKTQALMAALGQTAASSGTRLGAQDYMKMASDTLESLGVKDSEKNLVLPIYAQQIGGAYEQQYKVLDSLNTDNAMKRAMIQGSTVESLANSALQTTDPEGTFNALATSMKLSPELTSAVQARIKNGLVETKNQPEDSFTKNIKSAIAANELQASQLESAISSGNPPSQHWWTTGTSDTAAAKATVKQLRDTNQKLEDSLKAYLGGSTQRAKGGKPLAPANGKLVLPDTTGMKDSGISTKASMILSKIDPAKLTQLDDSQIQQVADAYGISPIEIKAYLAALRK